MARWACALALIAAAACGSRDHAVPPAEADEPADEAVTLALDVAREAGIEVAAVIRDVLPVTVELTGEVAADPDRSAQVSVRVAGRLVAVRFKEGDRVRAGQALATIESGEMARVRGELGAGLARAKAARQRVVRLTELADKGLAPRQDVEAAEAEAGSLEADLAAARQTLATFGGGAGGSARLELRAPIAGDVMRRDAMLGEVVNADRTIAEITDLDQAIFVARMYERDLARVAVGASAEIHLRALPDQVFTGTVETIGRQLDPVARAVVARIRIVDHDDLLKLGLFGAADVTIGGPTAPQLIVAATAVTRVGQATVVFVERGPGHFEPRPVRVGRADRGRVEILAGLSDGDRIAVAGVHALKSILLKSTFGEED